MLHTLPDETGEEDGLAEITAESSTEIAGDAVKVSEADEIVSAVVDAAAVGSPPAAASATSAASATRALAMAREGAFFAHQNALRDSMKQFADATSGWAPDEWLLVCLPKPEAAPCTKAHASASTASAAAAAVAPLSATIVMDQRHKAAPETFEYSRPLQSISIRAGVVAAYASQSQLAALVSISAHMSNFKLWSHYALSKKSLCATAKPSTARAFHSLSLPQPEPSTARAPCLSMRCTAKPGTAEPGTAEPSPSRACTDAVAHP